MTKFFLFSLTCVFALHAMDGKKRANSCPPAKVQKVQSVRKPPLLAPPQPATSPQQSTTPRTPRYSQAEKDAALATLLDRIEKEQHAYPHEQTSQDDDLLAYLLKLEQREKKLVLERNEVIFEQQMLTEQLAHAGALGHLIASLRGRKNSLSKRKDLLDQEIAQKKLERYVLAKKLDSEQNKLRFENSESSSSSSSQN